MEPASTQVSEMRSRRMVGLLLQGGRLAAQISLDDAALAAGIDRRQLTKLERGSEAIDVELLLTLLDAYEVPFSMFAVAFETARRAVALRSDGPPLASSSYDSPHEPSAPA